MPGRRTQCLSTVVCEKGLNGASLRKRRGQIATFGDNGDLLLMVAAVASIAGVLFCSGSAAGLCYSGLKLPVLVTISIIWVVVLGLRAKSTYLPVEAITAFLFIAGSVLAGSFANGELGHYSFAVTILAIIDSILIAITFGPERTLKAYVWVMIFLSAMSLVAFVFVVLGNFPPLPSMEAENGKTVYLNGIVFCIDMVLNHGRSIGIFWEPSIMAGYINVALFFVLVMRIPCRKWGRFVLYLALLATESSGGLIGFMFVVAGAVAQRGGKSGTLLALMAAVASLFFIAFYDQIEQALLNFNYEFFYKFFGGSESGTTQTRIDSPLVNLRIWHLSPLVGFGLDGTSALYKIMRVDSSVTNMAQTSTMALFLASFGILGISYTLAWVRALTRHKRLPIVSRVMGVALFVLFLNEVPCTQFVMPYILLFALLSLDDGLLPFQSNDSYEKGAGINSRA